MTDRIRWSYEGAAARLDRRGTERWWMGGAYLPEPGQLDGVTVRSGPGDPRWAAGWDYLRYTYEGPATKAPGGMWRAGNYLLPTRGAAGNGTITVTMLDEPEEPTDA